ncbi:MAG: hypothetical protein ACOC4M_03075 [Promethearchaeia archaeon]
MSLKKDDILEITYNTSSESLVVLNLYNLEEDIEDTLVVQTDGYKEKNNQERRLRINQEYAVDFLEISSSFQNRDNFILKDIRIYREEVLTNTDSEKPDSNDQMLIPYILTIGILAVFSSVMLVLFIQTNKKLRDFKASNKRVENSRINKKPGDKK